MTDYRAAAVDAANRHGIPPELFLRQIGAESGFNPNALSPAGALGLGQLMPDTAADLGVDPLDPAQNLDGAARYLKQQYDQFGDWGTALAAYNAGPGNVRKYGGVPPFEETRNYLAKIMGDGGGSNALAGYGGDTGSSPSGPDMTPEILAALSQRPEEKKFEWKSPEYRPAVKFSYVRGSA